MMGKVLGGFLRLFCFSPRGTNGGLRILRFNYLYSIQSKCVHYR